MIDNLFQLFLASMNGVKNDVHTCIVAILSILLIIIGFSVLMNVFNIEINANRKDGDRASKDDDSDF